MPKFYIQTQDGPALVDGVPYVTQIGDRTARLFIHEENPIDGPRLSCQRSGMLLGKLAPVMLARFVATGDSQYGQETVGAALLISSLIDRHGAAKLWAVMDRAPDICSGKA